MSASTFYLPLCGEVDKIASAAKMFFDLPIKGRL